MKTNVQYPGILAACVEKVGGVPHGAYEAVELYKEVLRVHALEFHERDEAIALDNQAAYDAVGRITEMHAERRFFQFPWRKRKRR